MNNFFSINSPIVSATLVLLILLSIVTWSIAFFQALEAMAVAQARSHLQ